MPVARCELLREKVFIGRRGPSPVRLGKTPRSWPCSPVRTGPQGEDRAHIPYSAIPGEGEADRRRCQRREREPRTPRCVRRSSSRAHGSAGRNDLGFAIPCHSRSTTSNLPAPHPGTPCTQVSLPSNATAHHRHALLQSGGCPHRGQIPQDPAPRQPVRDILAKNCQGRGTPPVPGKATQCQQQQAHRPVVGIVNGVILHQVRPKRLEVHARGDDQSGIVLLPVLSVRVEPWIVGDAFEQQRPDCFRGRLQRRPGSPCPAPVGACPTGSPGRPGCSCCRP